MRDCDVNTFRMRFLKCKLTQQDLTVKAETLQEVTKVEKTLEVTGETARQWA